MIDSKKTSPGTSGRPGQQELLNDLILTSPLERLNELCVFIL